MNCVVVIWDRIEDAKQRFIIGWLCMAEANWEQDLRLPNVASREQRDNDLVPGWILVGH